MPSFPAFRVTEERWRRFPARERLDEGEQRVALTFDDGPDPDGTPALLDALDAAGIQATFFMVGEQALAHRALAREVAERGHEIALHGFTHIDHSARGDGDVRDDLARGLGTIEVATGRRPRLFRPPYGRFSAASYAACDDLGLERVLWSAWGLDWEPIAPARIAEIVVTDLEPGAIVLLHDSARYAPRPDAAATAAAIPLLSAAGHALGPVTIA